MSIIDGKAVSKIEKIQLRELVIKFPNKLCFVAIQVGNDPASLVYLKEKQKMSEELNINFKLLYFEDLTYKQLTKTIHTINNDTSIHGCIIQLPLPPHINPNIVNLINYKKDVDGFTTHNLGCLAKGKPYLCSATPLGITKLIDFYKIPTKGKHCVIIGKSNIVGKPMSLLMANENTYCATVTTCDKHTINLRNIVRTADILIVCAGKHHLIDSSFIVKSDISIIDVGIHRIVDNNKVKGYRLEGDVDFNYFKDKCAYITPVPGGVGPMTVLSLMSNIVTAYVRQSE